MASSALRHGPTSPIALNAVNFVILLLTLLKSLNTLQLSRRGSNIWRGLKRFGYQDRASFVFGFKLRDEREVPVWGRRVTVVAFV